jgi:Na+-transporting NADH:ubiquinone oxidoreductase subunit F
MSTTPEIRLSDYSLVGKDTALAIEKGLAEATWYASPIPKQQLRELLHRRDWPAIRDTVIWFGLLIGLGYLGYLWWGHWYAVFPFLLYGVIYASTSDSRWHESSHGTAFKTDWLNNFLYEIASFMVMRESTPWRWSHTRHHSDTIIVGRDPEIAVPRPPNIRALILSFFNVGVYPAYFRNVMLHCVGVITPAEKTYIPEFEYNKVFWKARIYVCVYATAIGLAIYYRSFLPLMYVGLTNLYGSWLMPIYGYTQHAGLAENVLDHRLNCRTVYMNPINRFLYWNMNYHVEHHMFPLVPYHNLPKLHAAVKDDMPVPYKNLWHAWKEIVPAVLRQVKDPAYHVKRKIPTPTNRAESNQVAEAIVGTGRPMVDGWVEVCDGDSLMYQEVVRFDHEQSTFAVYRLKDGQLYATDGICTHGNTHLADGFIKGDQIECPKHNGRFSIIDGSPKRFPVCVGLRTYPARELNGKVMLNLKADTKDSPVKEKTYKLRVVGNRHVATFIKEVTLEPADDQSVINYQPGDYVQFKIPAYGTIGFDEIVPGREPFRTVWKQQHVDEFRSECNVPVKRNYSFATNPEIDKQFKFNVRIATPPRGQDCNAGSGSAYMHRLKPGDVIEAVGPFGTFRIKETLNEMVYIGGGSGMAPLRSHISYLFDTLQTTRRVSFWYGARSLQEVFYREYFEDLSRRFPNFTYHLVLSEAQPEDNWTSLTGFVHEALKKEYLDGHVKPSEVEYYLCGPPVMIKAAIGMLKDDFLVTSDRIAFDEF